MKPYDTAILNRQGGRESNQDCAEFQLHGDTGCWVVADGLGGHQGGQTAARIAVEKVLETFRHRPQMAEETIIAGFQAAQRQIVQLQEEEARLYGMRTTCVVLLADAGQALWGHLGDSRLYRFQDGRLVFQSKDHSVTQALTDAGEIRPEDMRHDENRNRLTRVLGKEDLAQPAFAQARGLAADEAFLLCTDGFWEYVEEAEMEIDLAKSRTPEDWLGYMEARLRSRANGEFDNYTAVAVFCHTGHGKGTLKPQPAVREPARTTAVPGGGAPGRGASGHVAPGGVTLRGGAPPLSRRSKPFPWLPVSLGFAAAVVLGVGLIWLWIRSPNQPPVAAADLVETDEGRPVVVKVLTNDRDPDNDALSVVAAGPAAHGKVEVGDDGAVTYTPNERFTGTDSFEYQVTDGRKTAAATVDIRVTGTTPQNRPPEAVDDQLQTRAGESIKVDVLDNDWDPNSGDRVRLDSVDQPEYGTVVRNADDSVTYTPRQGHTGEDRFGYIVTDGQLTDRGQVVVTVAKARERERRRNQPPIATGDTFPVTSGKAKPLAVLANDADNDGDPLEVVAIERPPQNGTATANNDGTIIYQSREGYEGPDEFTYRGTDGQEMAEAVVKIDVQASTQLAAADDRAETEAGQPIDIRILRNDRYPARGHVGIWIENMPAHGEAELNDNRTLTYRPDPSFEGDTDELTYRLEAGSQVATAKVTIEIKRREAPPEAAPQPGDVRTHRKDGLKYAWIPPAEDGQQGFWLGQTEATAGAYRRFAAATVREMPAQPQGNTDSHPVVSVRFEDATALCRWSGGRLPKAQEWEHAARGGLENPIYPWGNDDPSCSRDAPNGAAGLPRTCKLYWMRKVASYQPNGYQLYDMAGNAAEWCNEAASRNRKVVKGGGFRDTKDLKIARRPSANPEEGFVFIGFRCLRETPPEE